MDILRRTYYGDEQNKYTCSCGKYYDLNFPANWPSSSPQMFRCNVCNDTCRYLLTVIRDERNIPACPEWFRLKIEKPPE